MVVYFPVSGMSLTNRLYGATAGINAKLSNHWSAGASAQVLEVASSGKVPFYGTTTQAIDFKSATRPTFAVTVGYAW